jgi:kinesin family protein 5
MDVDFTLTCSILEIYKENLFDLLSDHKDLKIKESPARGIYVEGLAKVTICTEKEL